MGVGALFPTKNTVKKRSENAKKKMVQVTRIKSKLTIKWDLSQFEELNIAVTTCYETIKKSINYKSVQNKYQT